MIDIDISKALKNEGECGTFSYEGVPELGGDIDFAQPLELEAEFCVTDKKVSVTGNFDAVLNTVCDRCLTGMTTDVGYRFSELYLSLIHISFVKPERSISLRSLLMTLIFSRFVKFSIPSSDVHWVP